MGEILGHLKPESVFNHFEEICKYPRPSKKEEKIAEYIVSVGHRNQLETLKDGFGNIVIKKPATPGNEKKKTVALQGHIDMVCEKNRDVEHDFDNDPIYPYVDGEWIKAKGTTLGADNGIGVAAALAVIEDKTISHGPLEFLFTLDEETGLTGAASLDTSILKADILLNMDSEEEGSLYIGCSGGRTTKAVFDFIPSPVPAYSIAYELKVAGLCGGHSGLEIQAGRGNAVKIITRVLAHATKEYLLRLAIIEGGNKHNAIPREAFATVAIPESQKNDFLKFIEDFNAIVRDENSTIEPNLQISVHKCEMPKTVMDVDTQILLIDALYGIPHGVLKMSADIPGLVETSTNLAIVETVGSAVNIVTSQRSSVASELTDAVNMVSSVLLLAKAKVEQSGGYPGWKPNINSEILKTFKESYQKLFNKEPEVKAIHAGLECGIIGEKYPKMDMISFGPTMFDVHSPGEKLKHDTVQPFYDLLVDVLQNIPNK